MRWGYLSFGLSVLMALAGALMMMMGELSDISGLGLAFVALPAIWILLWTASYAAAVWLVVAIDTANGSHEIVNWGEQNWREWIPQMVYLEYLLGVAAAAAHGIGLLAERGGGPYWPVFTGAAILLSPIVIVSSLERGGSWNIFSKEIFKSLWRSPLIWAGFLILSGLLVGGWTWAWIWLLSAFPLLALAIGGPGWAAVLLIHARLLGRLALGLSLHH